MLLDCGTWGTCHRVCIIRPSVEQGSTGSYLAPDIAKFACSRVKCPFFLFFGNNYDPSFTALFLTLLI